MKWILFFSISLGWTYGSQAMIPISHLFESTINFYRTPNSPFVSGQAPKNILQSKKIRHRFDTWYLTSIDGLTEWIPRQDLFLMEDFGSPSSQIQKALVVESAQVLRQNKGWRPSGTLERGSFVVISQLRSDWVCGHDSIGPVCIPTDKTILFIDGANEIQLSDGTWKKFKNRIKNQIFTSDDHKYFLTEIKAWTLHTNLAFINPLSTNEFFPLSNNSKLFSKKFQKVTLLKKEIRQWNLSVLGDHGNVWWRPNSNSKIEESSIILSLNEIRQRGFFSQSLQPSTKKSIISAEGVFYSKDGEQWQLLSQFKEGNYPVALGPKNTLIVGDQISFNEGETFQSYLKWDIITQKTQQILKRSPDHLKIKSIKTRGPNYLDIELETGDQFLNFRLNTINNIVSYIKPT